MNAFADWLLSTIVATSILAAIVLGAGRLFRNRPALQHLLWLVVLIRFVCPPALAISVPGWLAPTVPDFAPRAERPERQDEFPREVPGLPRDSYADEMNATSRPSMAAALESSPTSAGQAPWERSTTSEWRSVTTFAIPAAIVAWLAGSLIAGIFQGLRILRLGRHIRSARPAPPCLAEAVGLGARDLRMRTIPAVVLPDISIPLVWCFGKTRLLWPEMLSSGDDVERCHGAILHELSHVRRGDHWIAWIDFMAGLLWWWNPIFWFVRRRLHESAELACDALALSIHDNDRSGYAELFLELSLHSPPPIPHGLGLCSGARKLFERRLTMMLSDVVRPSIPRRGWALALVLALAAAPAWSLSHATDESSRGAVATIVDSDKGEENATKADNEQSDPSRADRERLQGTWDIVKFFQNDQEQRNSFKLYQLTFKDKSVTTNWIREDDEHDGGTSQFTIDATRKPRELLMEGTNLRIQSVYRFEGDLLTIAFFGKPEKTRPQGFSVKDAGDSGEPSLPLIVWKLKRGAPGVIPKEETEKSDPQPVITSPAIASPEYQRLKKPDGEQAAASHADHKRLQGTWDLIGFTWNDKMMKSPDKLHQLRFHGDKVTKRWVREYIYASEEDDEENALQGELTSQLSIDTTREPHELLIERKNKRMPAIYRFDGDLLTIAFFGTSQNRRPRGFTLQDAGDSGGAKLPLVVWTLKRQKPTASEEEEALDTTTDGVSDDVTARFLYHDTMLILSSNAGVAAVTFKDPIDEGGKKGIHYEYRYESRNGRRKDSGEADLFETRNKDGELVGKPYIKAGDIRVRWSIADTDKGWIYYSPEKLRVQLANAKDFRPRTERRFSDNTEEVIPAIDLSRFQISRPADK